MKARYFLRVGCLALFFCGTLLTAQADRALLQSTLQQGLSPYANAMGQAYVAQAEQASGVFYNPAGISRLGLGLAIQNGNVTAEAENLKASSFDIKLSPLAFSYRQQQLSRLQYAKVYTFSMGSIRIKPVQWGLTFKHIRSSYRQGWSTDFGILLHVLPYLDLGLAAHDFMNNIDLPSKVTLGSSLFTPSKRWRLNTDLVSERLYGAKRDYHLNIGADYQLSQEFALQLGYGEHSWRLGFALQGTLFALDYSMLDLQSSQSRHHLAFRFALPTDMRPKPYRSLFKKEHFALIQLSGHIKSGKSEISLLGGKKIGSNELLRYIEAANNDKHCKGYILKLSSLSSGLSSIATLQEIRAALLKGKDRGKKIYVYINHWASMPDYYLASVADRIIMPELGSISHLGLAVDIQKNKGLLKKLGIKPYVISKGAYKTDQSSSTEKLSASERALLQDLLQNMYMQIAQDIHDHRGLPWDVIHEYFDGQLITAKKAKEVGLVDHLAFWADLPTYFAEEDEALAFTAEPAIKTSRLLPIEYYAEPLNQRVLFDFSSYIAVVEIDGFMKQGSNTQNFLFGQKATGSDDFDVMLEPLIESTKIKALLVRINSGGGSMLAADQMHQAIQRFRDQGKLVYSSMGNMAASGGYYVAMGTDKIFANHLSLTGSIGVMSSYYSLEGLYKMIGISHESLKTGKYMDLFSNKSSTSLDHLKLINAHQQASYDVFVNKVMTHRNLTQEEVFSVAQGQVFTGKQAKTLKLVDEMGSLQDSLNDLSKATGVSEKNIIYIRKKAASTFSLGDIFSLFF
eukprot:COSAG01_NODE_5096_length_4491_cov_1.662796_3_plen_796_part_00